MKKTAMRRHRWLRQVQLLGAWTLAMAAPWALASDDAYLLVHFTQEAIGGEQIYFATSTDGRRWTDLNGERPILVSTVGERGVRDPSIVRSADGLKFYILATDLRIAAGRGWKAALEAGSTKLVIYESTDLVRWSAPRLVDVAGTIPGAGNAWAPEAIYDEASGDYFVYWATNAPIDGITKPRIYYARTREFFHFTPARLYIDRPGDAAIIDTQIVRIDAVGAPYRYIRASGDGQITFEGSDALLGVWHTIGDLRPLGLSGHEVEGPILFRWNDGSGWGIWVDQYRARKGYLQVTARDLAQPATYASSAPGAVDFGALQKRHGAILNISRAEHERLLAAYPPAAVSPPDRKSAVAP